jgi:hypothetical protein
VTIYDDKWFEVWSEAGGGRLRPNWLYVVTPDEDNVGQIIVFDPQENYRIAYRAPKL